MFRCVIAGALSLNGLKGLAADGWDWNIAPGGRWSALLKGLRNTSQFWRLAKLNKATAAAESVPAISSGEWKKAADWVKFLVQMSGCRGEDPTIQMLDTPLLGAGVELSVFKGHYRISPVTKT